MAFNDCVHLRDEKDEYGRNICPYSPATSFACPYGSAESARDYCPKYTDTLLSGKKNPIKVTIGNYQFSNDGSGIKFDGYASDPEDKEVLLPLNYFKKAHYYLGKAIELMERENNDE